MFEVQEYDWNVDIGEIDATKIIVLGAGLCAQVLLSYRFHEKIAYICDNDIDKQGCDLFGVPIRSFDALSCEQDSSTCLLISSKKNETAFVQQIINMGLLVKHSGWFLGVIQHNGEIVHKIPTDFYFADRRKNYSKMLVMLAGYKPMLWEVVFKRLVRFIPGDVDICIATNGRFVDAISEICEENQWSYLSTKRVNMAATLNCAIMLHNHAEYVLKMDEDIFICDGFYEGLVDTYQRVEAESNYHIGLVAPTMPVNPHGYVRYLDIIKKTEEFTKLFGKPYYGYFDHLAAQYDQTIYLWENTWPLDSTAKRFRDMPFSYFVCPHRFSIGASLFKRETFDRIYYIDGKGEIFSEEEDIMVKFLTLGLYYTVIMAENVLAGHFAFSFNPDHLSVGKIVDRMELFYKSNIDSFDIS